MAEGHRKRLRDLVEKAGLENLSIYQQMEYILFYILPRVNTTDIAHSLIDTFGSIYGVLDAPASELQKIKGLGVDSAFQLSHLIQILSLYGISKNCAIKNLSTLNHTAKFFYDLMFYRKEENMVIVALTKKNELISYKKLAVGKEDTVTIDKADLINFVTANKAKRVLLGHNHPSGSCMPSREDDKCTQEIMKLLNTLGMQLYDHIIVGADGVFSFREICKVDLPLTDSVISYKNGPMKLSNDY